MKRFFILFILLSLNFILPKSDVAQESGDCSLIREAYANMAPPEEECVDRKIGEFCYTRFEGRPGKCEEVNKSKQCVADESVLTITETATTTTTSTATQSATK